VLKIRHSIAYMFVIDDHVCAIRGLFMTAEVSLIGLKVLVVEDEPLISMFIEDSLKDMGCQIIAIVSNLTEALAIAAEVQYDMVMLDVNLGGQQTFALAEFLYEKKLPFIFSTGYGVIGIPPHLTHLPVLQKPVQEIELKNILQITLAVASARSASRA